jgi:hypothetical protein
MMTNAPLHADAPQFTVQAAHYAFTAYNQTSSGWICDGSSDLNHGPGCYGQYPASAVFGESQVISQGPGTNGTIVWHTNPSPVRNGGFLDPQFYDELTSWVAGGPQAGPHYLRQVLYDRDRTTSNSSPPLSWANDHDGSHGEAEKYVNNSAFYEPAISKHIIATSIYASAGFPTNPMSGLYIVESSSGYNNFFWNEIFRSIRPNGQDGAEWHFNKASLVNDPASSSRWIGLVKASHPTLSNIMTPFYVDFVNETIGFKFVNEGWCEFPWGVHFTDYDTSFNCANAYNSGTGEATIPDVFAGLGDPYPGDFKTVSVVDGKVLALRTLGTTQGAYVAGDALCPPESLGFVHSLYATRSRQSPFAGARRFYTREVSPTTWTSSSGGIVWVGDQKQILDGYPNTSQAQLFQIAPTDSLALGGFSATLNQYNDGKVYLYLDAKVTLCEPDSNPSAADWNRFPINSSGGAIVWFRLTS